MTDPEEALWMKAVEADGIIVGDDGSVRFTSRYRKELAEYLAMAGIDIATIKTKDDYLAARRKAAPYFDEWVTRRAADGEPSTERSLLVATLLGDDREARKLKMKLDSERISKKKPQ